jgi:ABC-type proline/glycine betaine transport system ATPase subunit
MDGGRIVEQGSPEAIFDAPEDERLRTFLRRVTRPASEAPADGSQRDPQSAGP